MKAMRPIKRIFEYEEIAREYNIKPEVLAKLVDDARKDFPNDEMMVELHVTRALRWLSHQKRLTRSS